MFNTLGIDYRAGLTADTVRKSWTDAAPVKFSRSTATNIPGRATARTC